MDENFCSDDSAAASLLNKCYASLFENFYMLSRTAPK